MSYTLVYLNAQPFKLDHKYRHELIIADDSPNGGEARLHRYLDEKEVRKYSQGGQRIRFVKFVP